MCDVGIPTRSQRNDGRVEERKQRERLVENRINVVVNRKNDNQYSQHQH